MRKIIFAGLLAFGFGTQVQAQTQAQTQVICPVGVGKSQLTIERVMMNFGKYTMKADAIAVGAINPANLTDTNIEQAVGDLAVVEACADAVIEGTSDDLLPSNTAQLTGANRDQFIAAFKQAMSQFKLAVTDYAAALMASNGTSPRILTDVAEKKKIVDAIADQAHKHF